MGYWGVLGAIRGHQGVEVSGCIGAVGTQGQ